MRRRLAMLAPLLIAAAPFDPFGTATIVERPGAAIPLDGRFTDAGGHATTLRAAAAGRPILLAPVLHDCPNFCGVTLDGLLAAVATVAPRPGDVAVIALGIDPREGPAQAAASLRRLAKRQPGAPRVTALTGSDAAIRQVTDALGYRYAFDPRIGQYAHVAAVAVLTPDGHLSRWLYGIAPRPQEVHTALADARAGKTGGIVERLILLCYHYDPSQGRYGLAIDRLIKVACLATVGVLGLALLTMRRRERRAC